MTDPLDFTRRETVLIIDDTPDVLTLMTGVLRHKYDTKVANTGERGLRVASTHPLPDLILLDIEMPGMDGYEVCRRLKADPLTNGIPVIFLTAKSDVEDEQEGFAAGCVDYITKPISAPIVHARIKTHLFLKGARDFLKDHAAYLEEEVTRRTREALRTELATNDSVNVLTEKVEKLVATIHERTDFDPAAAPALAQAVLEIKDELKAIARQSGDSRQQ